MQLCIQSHDVCHALHIHATIGLTISDFNYDFNYDMLRIDSVVTESLAIESLPVLPLNLMTNVK